MKYLYIACISFFTFVLFGISSIKENLSAVIGTPSELYTASIYLEKGLSEEETTKVTHEIKKAAQANLKTMNFINIDTQMNEILNSLPDYATGLVNSSDLKSFIGPLIEIEFTSADSSQIIKKIKNINNVQQVVFGSDWIKNFEDIFNYTHYILNILFVFMLLFSVFFMSLLIRTFLLSEAETISILSLHGSTPFQTLKKYFFVLFLATLLSSLFGWGMYFASFKILLSSLKESEVLIFISTKLQFISIEKLLFVLFCLLLTLTISYFVSERFIIKKYFKYE